MLLTAKARKDAEDLVKASRVVGNDLTGTELIRPPVAIGDEGREHGEHIVLVTSPSSSSSGREEEERATFQRGRDANRVLDVSEVDIARIVPRVISHRVRLRDGPEDELLSSVLFGATFKPPPEILSADQGDESEATSVTLDSVKSVLVQILSEV